MRVRKPSLSQLLPLLVSGATALLGVSWNTTAQEAGQKKSPRLGQYQCVLSLERTSDTFHKYGNGGYNFQFPMSMAYYLAPKDPEAAYQVIVHGNFATIANSKNPADLPFQRRLVAALTCDGPTRIQTSGHAELMFKEVKRLLFNSQPSVDFEALGVRSVDPKEVPLDLGLATLNLPRNTAFDELRSCRHAFRTNESSFTIANSMLDLDIERSCFSTRLSQRIKGERISTISELTYAASSLFETGMTWQTFDTVRKADRQFGAFDIMAAAFMTYIQNEGKSDHAALNDPVSIIDYAKIARFGNMPWETYKRFIDQFRCLNSHNSELIALQNQEARALAPDGKKRARDRINHIHATCQR